MRLKLKQLDRSKVVRVNPLIFFGTTTKGSIAFKSTTEMENTRAPNKMGGKYNHENLNALVSYIQELEISLAKKDQELVAKDRRIDTLETEVSVRKGGEAAAASPVFRAKATYEAMTPLPDKDHSASSTPNQVSDDSVEVLPGSEGSPSHSLSHISSDEDSTLEHVDGRWPFDGSFEDLVAKSSSGKGVMGHDIALKEIGFVPISKEGRERYSGGIDAVTPLRPVARMSHAASPLHSLPAGY